jgi:hypothetical protein
MVIKLNGKDITGYTGRITWQDSVDTLGIMTSVDVARNPNDRYIPKLGKVGDIISIIDGQNLITDSMTTEVSLDEETTGIKGYDFAFYLNQSTIVKQLYKARADEAIKSLCNEFGVEIGSIPTIRVFISKIYKDKTIAGIIVDILQIAREQTGVAYRLEMRQNKLYIEPYANLIAKAVYKPASNLAPFDATKELEGVTKKQTIENMKNVVTVIDEDAKVLSELSDQESVSKFGRLQTVISADGDADTVGKNTLAELNIIEEDISATMLGDSSIRSGRILEIYNQNYELSGYYFIKQCTHTVEDGTHKMSLNLDKVVT